MADDQPTDARRTDARAEDELRLLVDQVRDYAIFRLEPDGRIASWNRGAQLMKGYTASEAVGTHFSRFYSEEDRAAQKPARALEIAVREGRYEEEGWRVRKDGSRFFASVIITPLFDDAGKHIGFGKVTRDLTDRRSEEEARRRLEQERIAREVAEAAYGRVRKLQTLSASLSEALSVDEVVDAVIRDGAAYLDAAAAAVLVPTADGTALRLVRSRGYQALDRDPATRPDQPLSEDRPSATAFKTGEPELLRSQAELKQRYPWFSSLGMTQDVEAIAALALETKGGRIGVLTLAWREPREFDEESRASMRILALHAAQALDRANLYTSLALERQRLGAVIHQMPSAVAIVEAPSGRTLLANAQNSAIFRPTAAGLAARQGVKSYGVYRGLHPDGREFTAEDWPLSRAILKGEVVRGEAIHIVRGDGTHGYIRANSSPVKDEQGQIVAGVVIYDDITEQRRSEDDIRFLASATKVLSSSLDWQTTLKAVAGLAVPTLADWCVVEMVNPDGTTEQLAVAHQDPAKVQLAHDLRTRFPPPADRPNLVRAAIDTGKPILIEQLTDEVLQQSARSPEHLQILRALGMRSAAIVPIKTRRGVAGAITLVTAELGREYSQKDLPLFEELAERMGLAVENARLYAEAQAAIQKRDDFLSVASHELKTPLTSLDLHIEGLRRMAEAQRLDQLSPAKLLEKLGTIERQSDRLRQLVEDLLDVARITAGKMTLQREKTDLGALVADVVKRFSEQATRAGAQLNLHADTPVVGNWDKNRIDQVVVNFLTNAVKYGGRNAVDITVELVGGRARLSVRDLGIGIDPKDHARIFERFERAASVRSFGGIGLGLWICKQIVDAHGGQLSVQSELTQGATFIMELPPA